MKTIIAQYKDLTRWDVKSFLLQGYLRDESFIKAVSEMGYNFKQEVPHKDVIKNGYRIISKINFGGELFLRDFEEIHNYKGKLFLVPTDSIIFSKINVKHGCVYFHSADKEPFVVSSEYPVIIFDKEKTLGKYLHMALRSDIAKDDMNARAAGMAKARTSLNEFLDLKIPIPDIKTQQKIVDDFYKAKTQAEKLQSQADEKEAKVDEFLMHELGIKKIEHKEKNGAFVVNYKDLERWDVVFNSKAKITNQNAKYEWKKLKDYCLLSQYGYTESATTKDTGTKFLRITDIDYNGNYKEESLPFVKIDEEQKEFYLLNEGDFVFARTGATAGKCCVAQKHNSDVVFASYLIRFKFTNEVFGKFLELYLNRSIGRQIIEDAVYSSAQPNINANQIQEIPIPLPPLKTQKTIVTKIEKMRTEVQKLRQDSTNLLQTAKDNLQRVIVGK